MIQNGELKALALKEEPRFLSILIKNKQLLMDAMGYNIKPIHFWNDQPRFLFTIMQKYYKQYGQALSRGAIDVIMDSISEVGKRKVTDADREAVKQYYDKLYIMHDADASDYELLRDHINNRYVQVQAFQIFEKHMENLVKATNNQVDVVKSIKEDFIKIENIEANPYSLVMDIEEGLEKAIEHIEHRRDNPDDTPAIMTGLKAIDEVYYGLDYGTYTVISGMINGGKTTLMFNIGFNMARAGYNVVYVSLEKKAINMYLRLLALHALVDYNRIKEGGTEENGLNDETMAKFYEAKRDLNENIDPYFTVIQEAQGTNLSAIISNIERIKSEKKIDVLIVDYLGVIGNETKTAGRPDLDDAMTSQRLQAYGRVNNFVTITAVQLKTSSSKEIRNKSKKATDDGTTDVSVHTEDLAGSKMIIADADNGLSAVLNNDSPPTKMFVFGTKAREGESRRTMTLDFDGRLGRVSDPIFEPGQVSEVDDILYNTDLSEDDLISEDPIYNTGVDDVVFPDEQNQNEIIKTDDDDLFDDIMGF